MSDNKDTPSANFMREAFCREVLKPGVKPNQAAKNAGYRTVGAGMKLLTLPDVLERVKNLHKSQMRRLQMEADEVLIAWSRIARFDPAAIYDDDGRILPIKEWPLEARLCVASIETVEGRPERMPDGTMVPVRIHKVKFNDRMDALNALGRHWNMFSEEAKDVGRGMSEGFADLIRRAQDESQGVSGLVVQH